MVLHAGDGTTDCCVIEYFPAGKNWRVVGSHGNSYLGAVDIKHRVLSILPEEVLRSVPEHWVEVLWVSGCLS